MKPVAKFTASKRQASGESIGLECSAGMRPARRNGRRGGHENDTGDNPILVREQTGSGRRGRWSRLRVVAGRGACRDAADCNLEYTLLLPQSGPRIHVTKGVLSSLCYVMCNS